MFQATQIVMLDKFVRNVKVLREKNNHVASKRMIRESKLIIQLWQEGVHSWQLPSAG